MLKIKNAVYILMFLLLVLIQVVVLNHVSFLTYAVPFVYIYFVLKLPIHISRNILLLLAFLIGFTIDLFTKTPGVNAAATTFIAFIRRPVIKLFFMTDETEDQIPGIRSMGWLPFLKYAILLVLLHTFLLIVLESFSLMNIEMILLRVVATTVLTILLILAIEALGFKRR